MSTSLRRTVPLVVLVCSLIAAAASPAAAQPSPNFTVPIVGTVPSGSFVGSFTVNRFVSTTTGIVAVGTLTGVLTDPAGVPSTIVRTVLLPVQIAQATCQILHLDIGPISLDLLGLNVDLSRIVLDITAESGAGKLLGNLLCAIAGLLDDPSGLARLLNSLLGAL
jgi:hypothetical protein